jgi:NAD(P)-dependent dehydrogenase (short-subunit alcohol dehydrogenase family)
MGETSEIANLALFLASSQAAYMSGEVISVDGGSRYRY